MTMLRIGGVSYLNARPLLWTLTQRLPGAVGELDTPKRVADRLALGEIDVGLVPVVELFDHPSWRMIPGIGIACRGAAESVRLYHRVPLPEIRALALDPSSRTSNLLAQVLLADIHHVRPQAVPLAPQSATSVPPGEFDAFVCIGDRTFTMKAPGWDVWDLGAAWEALTGKPFVFAVWAVRAGVDTVGLAEALLQVRNDGVARLAEIAAAEATRLGLDRGFCLRYLSEVLWYTVGPDEEAGLMEFNRRAAAHRFCPTLSGLPGLDRMPSPPVPRRPSAASARVTSGAGPRPASADPERVSEICARVQAGRRIDESDALALFASDDLPLLGAAARSVRRRLHPTNIVTYAVDRNINYTNVCVTYCDFCAFYRAKGDAEAYVLPKEVLYRKIEELVAIGGTHVLLQGGHHPDLKLEWYEDLLRSIRDRFPIALHSFSAPEIVHIAGVSGVPARTVLERLKASGLHSLPGGGAEILDDEVRRRIAPLKCSSEQWLDTHRIAHETGLRSTATMMFGVGETWEHRVNHLRRLRDLQDRTAGFTAFIGWTFQPDNTRLASIPPAGAHEYLKTVAVARCFLDNIRTVQSSWVTQGAKIGQVTLDFGADDMGSTMLEENVVSSAGTTHRLTKEEILRKIREAGYEPRQRTCCFEPVGERVTTGA